MPTIPLTPERLAEAIQRVKIARDMTPNTCYGTAWEHDGKLWYEDIDTLCDAADDLARVREALQGLQGRDGCFCGVGIGDPNYRGRHAEACNKARAALVGGKEA